MITREVTKLAPWALAFIVTFVIGWKFAGEPDHGVNSPSAEETQSAKRPTRPERRVKSESLSEQRMRSISDAGSPEEKLRAAIALANSISPSEFSAWAEGDRFSYRSGPEMFIFRMILFERWLNEDTDGLIAWAGENYYGQALHAMQFLASEQPEVLIEHYRQHPDNKTELKNLALIADKHPDLVIARLHELSLIDSPHEIFNGTRDIFKKLAEKSSGMLEASLSSLPPGLLAGAHTALLAKNLETDFSGAIRGLENSSQDWENFRKSMYRNPELQGQVLDHLQDLPESFVRKIGRHSYSFIGTGNATQWLEADLTGKGFTATEARRIRERALDYASYNDPETALSAIGTTELSDSRKGRIIGNAMKSAGTDPEKAEAMIGLLSSAEDKALARASLDAIHAAELKKTNPAEWLRTAASAPVGSGSGRDMVSVMKELEKSDPAALRQEFAGMSVEQKQNLASAIGESLFNGDVNAGFSGDAIRFFVENPPERKVNEASFFSKDPASLSSNYAVSLGMKDPAAATQWVGTLPDGEAKYWAQKNLAKNLVQYDPKAVEQWLGTLPAGEREGVENYLAQ